MIFSYGETPTYLVNTLFGLSKIARYTAVVLVVITLSACAVVLGLLGEAIRRIAVDEISDWCVHSASLQCFSHRVAQTCISMNVIVKLSEVATPFIYYPFILLSLLLLSRSTLFEGWYWPLDLVFVYLVFAGISLWITIHFVRTAVRARRNLLRYLKRLRSDYDPGSQHLRQLENAIEEIENLKRSVFVHWSEHPLLKAIALPSGSVGLLTLLF